MCRPKSKSEAETGSPSTSACRSGRCQPRGRIRSVATSSFSRYVLSGVSSEISRRTASRHVPLPLDDVLPGRRVRVLEVGHEDARARVERVDHHLAVDRAGDLAAAVAEIGRGLGDPPLAVADVRRLRQEARQRARVELELPLVPPLEQLAPPRIQLAVQARDEVERLAGEDLLVGRGEDLHVGQRAHTVSFVNCASSVEPLSASVSLSGATACVTRSK